MNLFILVSAFLLPHHLAAAEVQKGGKFDHYDISEKEKPELKIKVTSSFETTDGCNEFGIQGSFRKIENSLGESNIAQDYLADFMVVHTMVACDPLPEPRTISLETEAFEIEAAGGMIRSRVLVPENMALKIEE